MAATNRSLLRWPPKHRFLAAERANRLDDWRNAFLPIIVHRAFSGVAHVQGGGQTVRPPCTSSAMESSSIVSSASK